ncbi:DoxX family protein [Gordonia asplenii]|nr:MauE/DoxX family redox-associated membrane protein [Gordonia asplenii]
MSIERLSRILAYPLIVMGVLHFVAPKPFDAIIPDEIPADKRTLTYASGAAELTIGAGLLVPRTRRWSAAAAAALFVAVFPANVNTIRLWQNKPAWLKSLAWARLPLQIPMVVAAIKVYRGSAPQEQ